MALSENAMRAVASALDETLAGMKEQYGIAGMAAALTGADALLWHRGYGVTSAEKPWDTVIPQTLFRIASNTKLTVTLTAMQLCEQGRFALDVPVRTYLPWFSLADNSAVDRITIRKLLNHTAGLPAEYTPNGVRDEDRAEAVLREGLAEVKPYADPDAGSYLYSNWGVRIVAQAMTAVTGKLFSELCREYVLAPLGMAHTTFDFQRAATYSLALPHEQGPVVSHYIPINAARYAAGGLFSCVDDMTALARLILNRGQPLVSAASWEQIVKPYAFTNREHTHTYGLTVMNRIFCGLPATGHTGSAMPYRSCIWAFPKEQIAVAFVCNTEGSEIFTNHLVPEALSGLLQQYSA